MTQNVPDVLQLLEAAGVNPNEEPISHELLVETQQLIDRWQQNPMSVAADCIRARRLSEKLKKQCGQSAQAATKLEQMIKDLVAGNATLWHLEAIQGAGADTRAVCRLGNQMRELSIHPDVDQEDLRRLKSWEYVRVNEDIVVGVWNDDPILLTMAHGEIVDFKNYVDVEQHLVRVGGHGQENVVQLAETLWDAELTPKSRLVLQRDDPHRAISLITGDQTRSKFEVPLDQIQTRLEDLACVEELANRVIEEVLLRIFFTETRDQFGVEAMRGMLLYSYKPGMGKTAFMRAIGHFFYAHSDVLGVDVVLHVVKPNELKNMYHGEDARIVREEVWGTIRARQQLPRTRPLIIFLVLDEIDSLNSRSGSRSGGDAPAVLSSAQSDALEAMLAEVDGMQQQPEYDPPAYVLCCGMTNRPHAVDDALKRPGRFGDLVLAMPDLDIDGAESVMAIYARGAFMPWYVDGDTVIGPDESLIRERFLRPALASVFNAVVLHYRTDTQRRIDVTAGQLMASVHFKEAMNSAKRRAALRTLRCSGVDAVTYEDVVDCLLDAAVGVAAQMEADPRMLIRQLDVKVPVARVDVVPKHELAEHPYLCNDAVQLTD